MGIIVLLLLNLLEYDPTGPMADRYCRASSVLGAIFFESSGCHVAPHPKPEFCSAVCKRKWPSTLHAVYFVEDGSFNSSNSQNIASSRLLNFLACFRV